MKPSFYYQKEPKREAAVKPKQLSETALNELQEAVDRVKPMKEVYVNQQTYDLITEKLGFTPLSLKVNNYIPGSQVVIIDTKVFEKNIFELFDLGN